MPNSDEWNDFPGIKKLKNQVDDIQKNIDNLKDYKIIYLEKLRDKQYNAAKKYLEKIHNVNNSIKYQLIRLKNETRILYDKGEKFNTIVSDDKDNFMELDKNLEKELLKVQKINKEYLTSKATQNSTNIAASSAYYQYYIYTIFALILIGSLVLRK